MRRRIAGVTVGLPGASRGSGLSKQGPIPWLVPDYLRLSFDSHGV